MVKSYNFIQHPLYISGKNIPGYLLKAAGSVLFYSFSYEFILHSCF